ncbi:glycosyltransferase family 4 protein [Rothia sp. P5764]|uniref:glycosyltransferase family 4 protein n=1 Tax=Rothia sp. P5764 TaxID=3402654 RepID=UPI003ACA6445
MAVNSDLPVALHCVPVPDFGGVARHISDLAEVGLPGYRLVVLCPPGELSARLKELGAEVREADFGPAAGFSTSRATLNTVIDELKPAIVHSHLAYADVVAAATVNLRKVNKILRRGTHIPRVFTTEHGIAGDDAVYHGTSWRSRVMEQVHRVRLWGTDGLLAVSQSTADQMKGKWGARGVAVVYNGLDTARVASAVESCRVQPAPGALRVLSLSRLAPEKGLDVLVEAFAAVRQEIPGATLEIAGSGELKEDLQRQVAELGLLESVSFTGFVDPIEAMGRSDLLVQLSVWENCSYTLLDAKAAGLALVATAVGGNPEILDGKELVPSLNQMNRQAAASTVARCLLEQAVTAHTPQTFSWASREEMAYQLVAQYQRGR